MMSDFLKDPDTETRLTHVEMLFTWNLSPLQSSKFSFEYLLLPPRSALMIPPIISLVINDI